MKNALLVTILILFFIPFCLAYTEDNELSLCLKKTNGSYSRMYDCIYLRKEYYQSQNKKLLKELKSKLTTNDYYMLKNNQTLLSQYIHLVNKGEIRILNDTMGIMYQTFAEEILLMIHETNFQILSIINSNTYNRNKAKNIEQTKYKLYLIELRKKLTPDKYNDIVNSQKAWELYKKDIERSILPMIPTYQQQKYIKQIISEDRTNVIINVNSIFIE